jgi:hypothetical protein
MVPGYDTPVIEPGPIPPTPTSPGRSDGWPAALAYAIAAASLAQAIQVAEGTYHPVAIVWLTVAFLACLLGVTVSGRATTSRAAQVLLAGVLAAALAYQFGQLMTTTPARFVPWAPARARAPFLAGVMLAAALTAGGLLGVRGSRRLWFPALLAVHLALGAWIIHRSPMPYIDVFMFQREASRALAAGENPYSLRLPDIYSPRFDYYSERQVADGWLRFGFIYPPLSLLLAFPGQMLLKDFRFSQLAAMAAAAGLIGTIRPGRVSKAAAVLLLFSPRAFYVLEMGWTEPFAVLLAAATVFCASRGLLRPLPVALGLFFSVKQHLVLTALVTPLLFGRSARRTARALAVAGAVAGGLALPFLLWDASDFWQSIVMSQMHSPFRDDALSYSALLHRGGFEALPPWVPFAAVVPAAAVAVWRGRHGAAGFAGGCALVYFAFFAFAKQAFCNYYFFLLGLLCCALAAARVTARPEPAGATRGAPRGGGQGIT